MAMAWEQVTIICVAVFRSSMAQNSRSEAEKMELLDAHNMFRSTVNPPANNMLRMISKWSR